MGRGRKKKYDIEFIYEEFKKDNLILLSQEYKDINSKLEYICPNHPETIREIGWISYYTTINKCKDCEKESLLLKIRHEFEKRGYLLFESEYVNDQHKLRYICLKHDHEIQQIRIDKFRAGKGCRFCSKENRKKQDNSNNKRRIPFEKIYNDFKELGYIIQDSEDKYINQRTKLKCICLRHPNEMQYITHLSVQRGHRACKNCISEKRSGSNSPTWKGGVTVLNEYIRSNLDDWRIKNLKKYDYICFITLQKSTGNLEVHHTTAFHEIRDSVINRLNFPIYSTIGEYSEDELKLIVNEMIKEHSKIEGIPMLDYIHTLFHKTYGNDNLTIHDIYEFKDRYQNGEFDMYLYEGVNECV
jgi:hypothetical protein